MDWIILQNNVLDSLKEAAKPYKVRVSRNYIGLYKNISPLFWCAKVLTDPWNRHIDHLLEINVEIMLGPLEYDALYAAITNPDTGIRKVTDGYRASGFGLDTFCKKTYTFPLDPIESANETVQANAFKEIADIILLDVLQIVDNIVKMISTEYGSIFDFFIAHKDERLMFAGLSYIYYKEYKKAIACFTEAERQKKNWNLCFGDPYRYFHQVCIDYCIVMLSEGTWKNENVFHGIRKSRISNLFKNY